MRISLIAALFALCACSSNKKPDATETPELYSSSEFTRIALPSVGRDGETSIQIDWQHRRSYQETKLLVGVDKAWGAYPTVFGELGIDPGIVDSKQHVFGNAGIKMHGSLGRQRLSKYLDCGTTAGMANSDMYDVLLRIVSQVVPTDAGLSTLRTQVEGSAHDNAISGASVRCVSTGALEQRIARMISELVVKSGT